MFAVLVQDTLGRWQVFKQACLLWLLIRAFYLQRDRIAKIVIFLVFGCLFMVDGCWGGCEESWRRVGHEHDAHASLGVYHGIEWRGSGEFYIMLLEKA
ncbi:hypothetical protein LRR18_10415 [Mangrovimonas sp. AS39]|uniref:hypothetical protein n=1 Tax=Mangrovimonas futianensis TaxID=2895523 RepID=UPI001E5F0842|nr:hypothetical protein [Mangrovimonas futianensis]MCF1191997.1 hypothetical protein [Mangrovimonas futianensis]MCF1195691.1 hypothetical protein [Mangrovimonas futianensis]